ncbi:MAG TPA: hypothetical protein VGL72_00385 [Bryobacteraceae bacterium]|jgi:hypothetical protein
MFDTRRSFLQSAAGAAGISGLAVTAQGQVSEPGAQPLASKPFPPSEIQVPKVKFGKAEIGRLVCGVNQLYGFAHFNQILGTVMKEYYTPDRVCDLLHQCIRYGINAFNYVPVPRAQEDLEKFEAQGGKMNLICQGMEDVAPMVKAIKPHAVYFHGERTDRYYQEGRIDEVREWCKKLRDLGPMVGGGTHKPEIIALVEEQNWDVDFYAGCVYNRTRTKEEWQKTLGGELVEMQGDCYLQSDPPKMYRIMRATKKPCFAFKILAAGRVANVEQAFRTAYESIKPTDSVFIGMFPRVKDEVRENAQRVQRILHHA